MAQEPIIETSVRTDAEGNWQLDIFEELEPGLHPVVAIDEQGNQDEALIYIEETMPRLGSSLTERLQVGETQPLLPPVFAYAVFFLLLIIILLSVNMVRLGGKIDKEITKRKRHEARIKEAETKTCTLEEQYKRQHRYMRGALIAAVIAIVVAFIFGIFLNYRAGIFNREPAPEPLETTMVSVSGSLISPFSEQGVSGVDIVAGETRIRTDEGGWYAFTNILLQEGIRITHPELSRVIVKGLEEFTIDNRKTARAFPVKIYFDVRLFNTLAKIVDLEARGRYNEIYAQVAQSIQEKVSQEEFVANYEPIYFPDDITDQELLVTKVVPHLQWDSPHGDRLERVVAVTLKNNNQEATYYLMQVDDLWLLVE